MPRPIGVSLIAIVFLFTAAYLIVVGAVMLFSPGTVSMSSGADLLGGLEVAGPYSGVSGSNDAVRDIQVAFTFLASMSGTIYGGSSEVQRNILAKQVLHLH